ncbi:hypothetical protein F2Q69_00059596 [Brassica cretica]|uniref:Uncharacterized protein n=1 Tax=Brassica cretica TaxID=69181 RepID=A0A8S9RRQ7_BRACR|nr:hypothetical protein F2Q69_00059596 [Brassica cretica]
MWSQDAELESCRIREQLWGRLYRDRDTEADLIEREKLLEVFLGRAEAVAELWGRLYRDRDTEADLIEREKLLEVFLGRAEAVAEVLDGEET